MDNESTKYQTFVAAKSTLEGLLNIVQSVPVYDTDKEVRNAKLELLEKCYEAKYCLDVLHKRIAEYNRNNQSTY